MNILENEEINKNTSMEEPVKKTPLKDKDLGLKEFIPDESLSTLVGEFINAACHFGHPKLNPMAAKAGHVLLEIKKDNKTGKERYAPVKVNGCYIINLDKTIENLKYALRLIFQTVIKGDKILFLTTNEHLRERFSEIATQCGELYINVRYQPGTLTNNTHFLEKKRKLEISMNSNMEDSLTKKEKKVLRNRRRKTEEYFKGLSQMSEIPKLVILVGGEKEYKSIISEVARMNIALISLSDLDVAPLSGYNKISVPCNTKSMAAIDMILSHMTKVILRGYEEYVSHNKKVHKPEIPNNKHHQLSVEQRMMDSVKVI